MLQPEWNYDAADAADASWLEEEAHKQATLKVPEKAKHPNEEEGAGDKPALVRAFGQTVETKAIQLHDESLASRMHSEKAPFFLSFFFFFCETTPRSAHARTACLELPRLNRGVRLDP